MPWLLLWPILISLLLYRGVGAFDFINWDDNVYILFNPAVLQGLTWKGFDWAIRNADPFFMPVTYLSFMLNVTLLGADPGGFHLVNLLIHASNVGILAWLLWRLTGDPFRVLLATLWFAVHPMHVEAVAWISARKELLSAFFGLLAILAYHHWVTMPRPTKESGRPFYLLTMLCYLLSLMAKPMWISLPVLLLLLDYWPLRRLARAPLLHPLMDKIPLLAIGLIFAGHTILNFVQKEWLVDWADAPLGQRALHFCYATWEYLGLLLLPRDLAVFYPLRHHPWPTWQGVGAVAALVAVTWTAWSIRRRLPAASVAWFWFLLSLLPVSGIINGGTIVAMTDRWSYLPHLGLGLAIWAIPHWPWLGQSRSRTLMAALGLTGYLGWLAWQTEQQLPHWRNSETLWQRAIDATSDNAFAHWFLGMHYQSRGRPEIALPHHMAAHRLQPNEPFYVASAGNTLLAMGKIAEARIWHHLLLTSRILFRQQLVEVAEVWILAKQPREAEPFLRRVSDDGHGDAYQNQARFLLGLVLFQTDRQEEGLLMWRSQFATASSYLRARDCQRAWTFLRSARATTDHPQAVAAITPWCPGSD